MYKIPDLAYIVDATCKPMASEVLKDGELFITSEPNGEIPAGNHAGLGLYYRDTRFLSALRLWVENQPLIFLSSSVRESHFAQFELTNPAIQKENVLIPAQTVHVRALRVLEDALLQRMRFINFNPFPLDLTLEIELNADFLDIFEVRGFLRAARGEIIPPAATEDGAVFGYTGLDGIRRYTQVSFFPYPDEVKISLQQQEESFAAKDDFSFPSCDLHTAEPKMLKHLSPGARASFTLHLPPGKKIYLYMQIRPIIIQDGHRRIFPVKKKKMAHTLFRQALKKKYSGYRKWKEECASFSSSNQFLAQMLQRTITDLYALRTTYPELGTIVQAGIPWYAAPFGRDALITAWQTFLINPNLARDTLYFLAALQGKENNPWRDEEPGKILHELRRGELASCQEIPHTPYYGSIDATPWFIILLSETYRWTGDEKLITDLKPHLLAALEWCEKYGDLDGDGFLEYSCRSAQGLTNQGWKDSWDGVIDLEGNIPAGPIALVEVQAYYYLALVRAAEILKKLGMEKEAEQKLQIANQLQKKFLNAFWLEEEEYLAFALDGNKKPITTPVSNAGHCLFTGILPEEMAKSVARRLFKADMYSGWGIRTMSKAVKPYNPMSYHNGSVWPHDNAIIAAGLRQLHLFNYLERLITNLFEGAMCFPYYRLPELFCGFTRRQEGGPVLYSTACNPQAWAVGTIPFLVQLILGISCYHHEVHIRRPFLPRWIDEIVISNLRVGDGKVDLEFTRKEDKTYCSVLNTSGEVKVIIETG